MSFMRNYRTATTTSNFGFGYESDPRFAARAGSQDQVAIVQGTGTEIVAGHPIKGRGRGPSPIDLVRYPSDFDLAGTLSLHRTRELGLPPISVDTHFLTAVTDYSERTRILAIDGERLAYDDATLLQWLISAEQQMLLGTDNHPVFETALENTACAIRRLPNGLIAMTEVSRAHVESLGARVRSLMTQNPGSEIDLCVETPLRAAARYFITETANGSELLRSGKESEVTAFLLVSKAGYNLGLWSPACGLFSEYGFLAPDQLRRTERSGFEQQQAAANDDTERSLREYIRKTFDQVLLQMAPQTLENLQLSNYAQVVWAADPALAEVAAPIAREHASRTGYDFIPLDVPADYAVAGGLLLGSYSFGKASVEGAADLAPVDITRDILVLAETEAVGRRSVEEARLQNRRSKAALTMLAAPVIVTACLLAFALSLIFSQIMTGWREANADAKTLELKPALERRKSYEANLKWYQEFIAEVSKLRRQQPVGTSLLYQLNGSFPLNLDPTFYVSDLKLLPTGDVEMKGLARNKDAVATFLKSLEFASGAESGSRLFSNLAYEVQETTAVSPTDTQVKLPSGSTLSSTPAAPGVILWSIKGNYLPMAEFAPKPAASPGAPAAPAAPPAGAPAASPPAAAATP
jgi:hypothetical protein